METSPAPWIAANRNSHERLRALVEPLDAGQLQQRSYASQWSIAQVLSHLGSQAEIFGVFLDAGLKGQDPPGPEVFPPIWAVWNAKSPQAQASDAVRADGVTLERFESLDADQRASLHMRLFGMEVDAAAMARMRLGEHAVHTWDIAVALDPTATISPDAVSLLIDTLDLLTARTAKPDGKQRLVRVSTSDPERHFVLKTGDAVTLSAAEDGAAEDGAAEDGAAEDGESPPELSLPAEAFIRLVYGRLDPAHTPPVEADGIDIDELRQIFPGF